MTLERLLCIQSIHGTHAFDSLNNVCVGLIHDFETITVYSTDSQNAFIRFMECVFQWIGGTYFDCLIHSTLFQKLL
jgi:hypothetical protein